MVCALNNSRSKALQGCIQLAILFLRLQDCLQQAEALERAGPGRLLPWDSTTAGQSRPVLSEDGYTRSSMALDR